MVPDNPYNKYQQIKVNSASKEDLIIIAYDGALSFISKCLQKLESQDLEAVHFSSLKAQAIINELMVSLNLEQGGEIAQNLFRIYDFVIYQLVLGNTKKEKGPFLEAREILLNLRPAWLDARKNTGT
ncbi:MAG: flagellar export chaperone FliS [Actinomycetota bacterium]|jgi:flagellar protein FliS|nr:flagellar export chaperone FliS [Actinomycetota bacterium]